MFSTSWTCYKRFVTKPPLISTQFPTLRSWTTLVLKSALNPVSLTLCCLRFVSRAPSFCLWAFFSTWKQSFPAQKPYSNSALRRLSVGFNVEANSSGAFETPRLSVRVNVSALNFNLHLKHLILAFLNVPFKSNKTISLVWLETTSWSWHLLFELVFLVGTT